MTDITDRLRHACNGHPYAKIEWPHRLLHDAVAEIEKLRSSLRDVRAITGATQPRPWTTLSQIDCIVHEGLR